MLSQAHGKVLRILAELLATVTFPWAVSGSAGMALHGVPVDVHDIDIQTDEEGAYRIEEIFASHVIRPVHFASSDRIRSFFGALRCDDVEVEIMGNVQTSLPDGGWTSPPDLRRHTDRLDVQGLTIPALSIEYESQAYEELGRTERARQLRDWLEGTAARSE